MSDHEPSLGESGGTGAENSASLAAATSDLSRASIEVCLSSQHAHEELTIELWKQALVVQQHFNDLELRIRNFAVTAFVAVVGATALTFRENLDVALGSYHISLAAVLVAAGMLSWTAFYFMDRWWYHLLLRGAVRQAMALEDELTAHFRNASLAGAISRHSPIPHAYSVLLSAVAAGAAIPAIFAPAILPYLAVFAVSVAGFVWILRWSSLDSMKRKAPASPREKWLLRHRWHHELLFVVWAVAVAATSRAIPSAAVVGPFILAIAIVAIHERTRRWAMHSSAKIDLFYASGLILYVAILVGALNAKPTKDAAPRPEPPSFRGEPRNFSAPTATTRTVKP